MSGSVSTKPYMLRALYEWCVDCGYTPYLAVMVDANTRVPMSYVKDGEIVLNINNSATKGLLITNEAVTFSARFNGVSMDIYVPMSAVRGIFARENGQGLFFEPEEVSSVVDPAHESEDHEPEPPSPKKPSLRIVK